MQKPISPKITALTFGVLTIAFLAVFYVVAWQEPTQAPPQGNAPTPLNVGPIGQSKEGGLILNTGNAPNGLVIDKGNLCLGTDCRNAWPTGGGLATYVGTTTSNYDGAGVGGYSGGNAKCNAEFSGSRMCMAADFVNKFPDKSGWFNTFVASSVYRSSANMNEGVNDCGGWSGSTNVHGNYWGSSQPNRTECNYPRAILCCR